MTILDPFNEAVVEAALRLAKGNLAAVAERLGVGRGELAQCVAHRAKLLAIVDDAREAIIDHAESALRAAVANEKPWAIRFSLTLLGARRELRHATPKIGPDLSCLNEEQLAEIAALMPIATEVPPPPPSPSIAVPMPIATEVPPPSIVVLEVNNDQREPNPPPRPEMPTEPLPPISIGREEPKDNDKRRPQCEQQADRAWPTYLGADEDESELRERYPFMFTNRGSDFNEPSALGRSPVEVGKGGAPLGQNKGVRNQ